jgi:hypothetical protein
LILLDESGVTTSMTRLGARCVGGHRLHEAAPCGHWKIMTILGAMNLQGMIATMTIEEATDADIFLAYVEHVLCPTLKPGHVVVMDKLSSHKVAGVKQRIESAGAGVLYLPPYSPNLNPIEKHGQNSSSFSAPQKPEPRRLSNKPSLMPSRRSPPRERNRLVQTCNRRSTVNPKCSNAFRVESQRSSEQRAEETAGLYYGIHP